MAEGNTTSKESVLLAWKALEYPDYERDLKYYLAIGVLFLALVGYSLYTSDWFGAAVLVVLASLIVWYQKKKPVEHVYRLSQLGIYIDNRFYPYNELYSFWLLIGRGHDTLNIIFGKKYLPQLSILLGDADPLSIRNTLGKYIPEESTRTENITDIMMRWFRL